jgi:hypothetical protein
MNLKAALAAAESPDMSARVNAASDLRLALRIASAQPAVAWLFEQARTTEVGAKVASRLIELSHEVTDSRYENPRDVALLIYTWILNQRSDFASLGVSAVARTPNLWWASKLARYLTQVRKTESGLIDLVAQPIQTRTDAGENILLTQPPPDSFVLAVDVVAGASHSSSEVVTKPSTALRRSVHNTGADSRLVRAA